MSELDDGPRIVQTDLGAKDGQNKCPKCGATDISVNAKTGMLRCNYCRHEFQPEYVQGMETDIHNLHGEVMGSGTQDISTTSDNMMTFKCNSCGAEVVIDTSESTQARCHWCRNTLSINQQIPNGAVPDVVLPFKLPKNEAKAKIEEFVGKRKFFAHPKFTQEFTTENVMGVYFPYMVVDINSHATFSGRGEHEVRRYSRGSGEHQRTYYDADLYDVERDFDLSIKGLTVESSADKLNKNDNRKTNNIINAIMPFDVENSLKWDSNYLRGYTSEKRDTNVDQLRNYVDTQAKDIARFSANKSLKEYDRGVHWNRENLDVFGRQWKTAYLPVWLYSYREEKGNGEGLLHYVAVNARTKETMGSVPIHMPKLIGVSALIEILCFIAMLFIKFDYNFLFLLIGLIFFCVNYFRYRNTGERHHHESETPTEVFNLRKSDRLVKRLTGLSNSRMEGANNTKVSGTNFSENLMQNIDELNPFK